MFERLKFDFATLFSNNIVSYGTTYVRQGAEKPRGVIWCSFQKGASIEEFTGIKISKEEDTFVGFECDINDLDMQAKSFRSYLYTRLMGRVAYDLML